MQKKPDAVASSFRRKFRANYKKAGSKTIYSLTKNWNKSMQLTAFIHRRLGYGWILPKILRVMQLTTALLLGFCLQAAATGSAQTITFSGKEVPLEKVFSVIKKQTGFLVSYRADQIKNANRVTINSQNMPLEQFLTRLLENQPFEYTIEINTIFIKQKKVASISPGIATLTTIGSPIPNININGTVTNENSEPLEGVSVSVKGTDNGTTTNADGRFNLSVTSPGRLELVFSTIGYETKTVPIGTQTTFNITLEKVISGLADVVVIGYGTQKKATLTGAVSSVKGDEINRAGAANISETMAGKISGLSIEPVSGEPGVNPVIHIRGIGTTGSSAPLVVVDGIIRDNLTSIDPAIIESVSVLKDAAAVAPYGLGGANGVLLITTKTGKAEKLILSVNAYKGNQKATWLPHPLNAVDYMKLQNEAATNVNSNSPPPYSEDFINNYNANHILDPDNYPDADPSDLLNQLSPVQNYNVNASGGAGATNYFISGGYFKQDGLFDQINFNRYNFSAKISSRFKKNTKISASIINSFEHKNELSPTYSSASMLRWQYFAKPTDPLYYSNGKWGASNNTSLVGGLKSGSYNKTNKQSLLNTFVIDQQLPFLKGLSVKGVFSYDLINTPTKGFSKPAYYWVQDDTTFAQQVSNMEQTSAPNPALYESYSRSQTFTYQGFVNYQKRLDLHEITFLGVAELRKSNYKIFSASMKNLPLAIDEFNLGSSNTSDYSISGSSSKAIQVGYVYRAGYVYNSKYMFEAAGRYDGHYYFAPGKRFSFFPSFSLGWRLSEEEFMKPLTFIDNLKIRGSWGKSGNLAGSAYQYLAGYGFFPNQYAFGGVTVPAAYPNRESNPNITWEISNKSDIGIEASLCNNLLTIEADYFFENRSGMLLPPATTVPFEYGIDLSEENEGIMNNHGIELTLGSIHQFRNGLRVGLNGNFSFAKNKMLRVFETAATFDNPNRKRTGRPINTPFGYNALGLFSTADDKNGDGKIDAGDGYSVQQFSELHPGDIKYEDVNNDGKIDANDEVAIGYSSYPQITYGFTPSVEWKGFDIALFFQGVAMNSMNVNNRFQTVSLFNTQSNTDYEFYFNHWTPERQDARYPRAYIGPNPNNNNPASSFWYKRGDYFRLKNLMAGYTIPQSVLKPLNIASIRVYFSATNVFTITKVKFFDPEAIYGGAGAGNYPSMKQFIFGASLSF